MLIQKPSLILCKHVFLTAIQRGFDLFGGIVVEKREDFYVFSESDYTDNVDDERWNRLSF